MPTVIRKISEFLPSWTDYTLAVECPSCKAKPGEWCDAPRLQREYERGELDWTRCPVANRQHKVRGNRGTAMRSRDAWNLWQSLPEADWVPGTNYGSIPKNDLA